MRLDRTTNPDGKGKYILIKAREIPGTPTTPEELAAAILENPQCVDFGYHGTDSEFFVIRLKDIHAPAALHAYAASARVAGAWRWAYEIEELAYSAEQHPRRKMPD